MPGDKETPAEVLSDEEAEMVGQVFDGDGDGDSDAPEMIVGEPFAMASGNEEGQAGTLDLIRRDPAEKRRADGVNAVQGCIATIGCRCGELVLLDLLKLNIKTCPYCKARYTTILMVADEEDTDILRHLTQHLLSANGQLPNPEEEAPEKDE